MGKPSRRYPAHATNNTRSNNSSGCNLCQCINSLLGLLLMAAAGIAIWYFLGKPETVEELGNSIGDVLNDLGDFGNFTDVLPNITADGGVLNGEFWDNDPYLSDNTTQSWLSKNDARNGLSLTLQNALDDLWQEEFVAAVSDWENGDPDALTLTTQRVAIDHSCKQVSGLMKVCNGNYGETGWLGINEILSDTRTGQIQSSVAKMNEYYLLNADYYERQYTMCHEIGHGFGLPHTDESFTNEDLGNCLDYTRNPKNNLHPDETNYNRLVSLYGTVPTRRRRRTSSSSSSSSTTTTTTTSTPRNFVNNNNDETSTTTTSTMPQEYLRGSSTATEASSSTETSTTATTSTTSNSMEDVRFHTEYEQAIEEFVRLSLEKRLYPNQDDLYNDSSSSSSSSSSSWRMLQEHETFGSSTFVRRTLLSNNNYELTIHVLKPFEK